MKEMEDESVDLVITDPPYLINYRSNRRIKMEKFNYIENDKDANDLISKYIKECYRILKNNTAIYLFCSWHNVDFFKTEMEKYFKLKNIIVWNKNNHGTGDLKGAYAPKHEFIIFGHKGRSLLREKRIPDIIEYPKIPSKKLLHPTEKPVGLLEIFIRNSSDEGDYIFDGFAGSGVLGEAAENLGRNSIMVEKNNDYCKTINDRMTALEGSLFNYSQIDSNVKKVGGEIKN